MVIPTCILIKFMKPSGSPYGFKFSGSVSEHNISNKGELPLK